MSKPAIEVRDLGKRYRLGQIGARSLREELERFWGRGAAATAPETSELWALRHINMTVERGEVLGLVGRNGSGKSTLLKILSRITEPTEGEAVLRGRVASLLEVGTGFHPDLTGRENIFVNGAILGMRRREITARFEEIVEFAEMGRYIDTPVKRYSSGQRVRLAFAVAAHLNAEILIADEVLAVGDQAFQKRCLGKMKDVSQTGRTVLFVSHNMQAVSTLTTRCLLLREGRQILVDTPDVAIRTYLNDETATHGIYTAPPHSEHPSITRVEVRTTDPGQVQQHGEPLRIEVDAQTPHQVLSALLDVQICSDHGVPIAHFPLHSGEADFFQEPGTYRAVCEVPRLHLHLGSYHLRVRIRSTLDRRGFDKVENVCPFSVVMHGIERPWPWHSDDAFYAEDFSWTAAAIPRTESAEG